MKKAILIMLLAGMTSACATDGEKIDPANLLTRDDLQKLISSSGSYYSTTPSANGPVSAKIAPDLSIEARDNLNGSSGQLSVDNDGRLCFKFNSHTWTSGCYEIYRTKQQDVFVRKGKGNISFKPR